MKTSFSNIFLPKLFADIHRAAIYPCSTEEARNENERFFNVNIEHPRDRAGDADRNQAQRCSQQQRLTNPNIPGNHREKKLHAGKKQRGM